jgi:hypothetical protein
MAPVNPQSLCRRALPSVRIVVDASSARAFCARAVSNAKITLRSRRIEPKAWPAYRSQFEACAQRWQ